MKILFFDTETTGLDFERSAIIQFGAILDDFKLKLTTKLNIKIKPHEDALIEDAALEVNKTSREDLLSPDRVDHKAAYKEITDMCGFPRQVRPINRVFLCGYNILSFDIPMFYKMAHRSGDQYPHGKFHWPGIDIAPLAAFYLGKKRMDLPNFKLMTVAEALGIKIDLNEAHDALYDVEITRKMYYKLCKYMGCGVHI